MLDGLAFRNYHDLAGIAILNDAFRQFGGTPKRMVLVGTIMVQAGHILTDPRRSPFVERLTQSVPYGDRLDEFTVVICDDQDMARKGAFVLANLMQ